MSGPKPEPFAKGWRVQRSGPRAWGLGRGDLKISGRTLNPFCPAIRFLKIFRMLRDMVRGEKVYADGFIIARRGGGRREKERRQNVQQWVIS